MRKPCDHRLGGTIEQPWKAIVKKELCNTTDKAKRWLLTSALDFLHSILETYKNGNTLLLIPDSNKWLVI